MDTPAHTDNNTAPRKGINPSRTANPSKEGKTPTPATHSKHHAYRQTKPQPTHHAATLIQNTRKMRMKNRSDEQQHRNPTIVITRNEYTEARNT